LKPSSLLGHNLELVEIVALPGAYPADARVGRFFRERRYLGSRDRRFVGDATYGWLRQHFRARRRWRDWAAHEGISLPGDDEIASMEAAVACPPRSEDDNEDDNEDDAGTQRAADKVVLRTIYVLDVLALARDELFPWTFAETVDAVRGLPGLENSDAPWNGIGEKATADDFLASTPLSENPLERFYVESSLPRWLSSRLIDELELDTAQQIAAAFLQPACVDLRVNQRLRNRQEILPKLHFETGLKVELTPYSHLGLRIGGRKNLTATTASRKNWVDVQDEGSQIAVLCADPSPGTTVIDACAGNGGKALAFADLIFPASASQEGPSLPHGRIYACDVSKDKLVELGRRASEAELMGRISLVHIYPAGPLPDELPAADLVFVDAPCSGLGTLRRNPELKRRYGPEDVETFAALQLSILERFAPLVKPDGRLVYITCSFLRGECEDVAAAFEERRPEFQGYVSDWAKAHLPATCVEGNRIRIDPVRTATDAFFVAQWKRAGG